MTLRRKRLIFGVILALGGLTITAMALNFSPGDLKMKILRDIIAVVGLCNAIAGIFVFWMRDVPRDGSPST